MNRRKWKSPVRELICSLMACSMMACGGGSESSSNSSNSESIILTALDGYLNAAQVYVDSNENGKADSDEYVGDTNENGQWSLDSHYEGYRVIVKAVAGVTSDSDYRGTLDKGYELIASAGATVVNPFTTLAYIYNIDMDSLVNMLDSDGSLGLSSEMLSSDYAAQTSNRAVITQTLARSITLVLEELLSGNYDSDSTTKTVESSVSAIADALRDEVKSATDISSEFKEMVIEIEAGDNDTVTTRVTTTSSVNNSNSTSDNDSSSDDGSDKPINAAPVVDAGNEQHVDEQTKVSLNATAGARLRVVKSRFQVMTMYRLILSHRTPVATKHLPLRLRLLMMMATLQRIQ